MATDIRWIQRFDSYCNALTVLERAVVLASERPLTELEEQGLIQGFEFTHELSWNLLKDYLAEKGFEDIHGSKDTVRLAFKEGLLEDGEIWMDMIRSRNASSHTYNIDTAHTIVKTVIDLYFGAFVQLREKMNAEQKRA